MENVMNETEQRDVIRSNNLGDLTLEKLREAIMSVKNYSFIGLNMEL